MTNKRILNGWHKKMLPFVEKHKNENSRSVKGYWGGVSEDLSHIEFNTFSKGLFMKVYFSEDHDCEFTYGRKIKPFGEDSYENNNFGGSIVSALKDCFDAEGFKVAFGNQPFLTYGLPGIGFQGRGSVDLFDSYIGLVGMTEKFIDLKLKRLDQVRERNFLYVRNNEEARGFVFKRVERVEDLIGVDKVYAFAIDPKISGMLYNRDLPEVSGVFEEHKGKIVSMEDFLKGK